MRVARFVREHPVWTIVIVVLVLFAFLLFWVGLLLGHRGDEGGGEVFHGGS